MTQLTNVTVVVYLGVMDISSNNPTTTSGVIFHWTPEGGYDRLGPRFHVHTAELPMTVEVAKAKLAEMAELGEWPAGEYHVDFGPDFSGVPTIDIV